MIARRLMRIETEDGTLFVPAPAYRCWRCDALMPVEREREPLCEGCESAAADKATIRRDTSGDGRGIHQREPIAGLPALANNKGAGRRRRNGGETAIS